jgi:Holliday junction resolvase RusA-like endonuclease
VDGIPEAAETVSGDWRPGRRDKDWAFDLYAAFARAGDDEYLVYSEIEGDPWSKSRPRFTRRGRPYQPRDDRLAEQALRTRLSQRVSESFPGNVMLLCRFYRANLQRIDADNLIKHVCDSATGVLWHDDSQVTLVVGEVLYDPERPRTIILVGNHDSNLLRGEDRKRPCVHCGEPFLPSDGKRMQEQRFCSAKCAYAARTTVLSEIACQQCHQLFKPKTKTQIMCSRECSAEWRRGRKKSTGIPRSCCADCGKELGHWRGGRCRDCWRQNPRFYGSGQPTTRTTTARQIRMWAAETGIECPPSGRVPNHVRAAYRAANPPENTTQGTAP